MSLNLLCATCKFCHFERNVTPKAKFLKILVSMTCILQGVSFVFVFILKFKTTLFATGPNNTLTMCFNFLQLDRSVTS